MAFRCDEEHRQRKDYRKARDSSAAAERRDRPRNGDCPIKRLLGQTPPGSVPPRGCVSARRCAARASPTRTRTGREAKRDTRRSRPRVRSLDALSVDRGRKRGPAGSQMRPWPRSHDNVRPEVGETRGARVTRCSEGGESKPPSEVPAVDIAPPAEE